MKSAVGESLERDERMEVLRLSPEERVRLSLALGERCVRLFAEAQELTVDEARSIVLARRIDRLT